MDYKHFITHLPPTYWSPRPPETYTIQHDGRVRGIGKIAAGDYGAWNLIYDKFDWRVWEGHDRGVLTFSMTHNALLAEVGGASLSDTVVALGPIRWPVWWKANRAAVPAQCRSSIDYAMQAPRVKVVG